MAPNQTTALIPVSTSTETLLIRNEDVNTSTRVGLTINPTTEDQYRLYQALVNLFIETHRGNLNNPSRVYQKFMLNYENNPIIFCSGDTLDLNYIHIGLHLDSNTINSIAMDLGIKLQSL